MALRETAHIIWLHIKNASFIHFAICDQPCSDQFAQPCGGAGVELVVISRQILTSRSSHIATLFNRVLNRKREISNACQRVMLFLVLVARCTSGPV